MFFRPTYPNFFAFEAGNRVIIFFGLIEIPHVSTKRLSLNTIWHVGQNLRFNDEDVHLAIDLGDKVQCRIREVLDNESYKKISHVSNIGSENSRENSDEESDLQI
jgi:hypothetical protein